MIKHIFRLYEKLLCTILFIYFQILWCVESEQWIPEEPYELSNHFPAAPVSLFLCCVDSTFVCCFYAPLIFSCILIYFSMFFFIDLLNTAVPFATALCG